MEKFELEKLFWFNVPEMLEMVKKETIDKTQGDIALYALCNGSHFCYPMPELAKYRDSINRNEVEGMLREKQWQKVYDFAYGRIRKMALHWKV